MSPRPPASLLTAGDPVTLPPSTGRALDHCNRTARRAALCRPIPDSRTRKDRTMSNDPGVDPGAALDPETEPVVARTIGAVLMTILADAFVAAGVNLSAEWRTVIAGAVNLLILACLAYLVRRKVFSPATVARIVAAARRSSPASGDQDVAPPGPTG